MPIANFALTLREAFTNFCDRTGIHTSQVAIRRHISWGWYVLFALAIAFGSAILTLAIAYWLVNTKNLPSPKEHALQEQVNDLENKIRESQDLPSIDSSAVQIAQSAQRKLLEKIKILEQKNTELKEEVKIYERIGIKGKSTNGLALERIVITPDSSIPPRYRYRLLIAHQGKSSNSVFQGTLQFKLSGKQSDGQKTSVLIPGKQDKELDAYQLNIRNVESKEGYLVPPQGMLVSEVEIQVVKKGKVRAREVFAVPELPATSLTEENKQAQDAD